MKEILEFEAASFPLHLPYAEIAVYRSLFYGAGIGGKAVR